MTSGDAGTRPGHHPAAVRTQTHADVLVDVGRPPVPVRSPTAVGRRAGGRGGERLCPAGPHEPLIRPGFKEGTRLSLQPAQPPPPPQSSGEGVSKGTTEHCFFFGGGDALWIHLGDTVLHVWDAVQFGN